MIKLNMNNYNMIKKNQKKSALSSGKIDKYEYLTYLKGEEILSSDQSKIIE